LLQYIIFKHQLGICWHCHW